MNKILVCLNASPNAKAIINAAGFFAKLNPNFVLEILHVLKPSDNVDMIDYSAMMGMDTTGRFLDSLIELDAQKAKVAREPARRDRRVGSPPGGWHLRRLGNEWYLGRGVPARQ